jgi:arginine-tRNA-protein transferase
LCQQRNLKHLYLGYWIKDCDKMNYKIDFRPIELFVKNRWVVMR